MEKLSSKEKYRLAYARKMRNKKLENSILDNATRPVEDQKHIKARKYAKSLKECRYWEDSREERKIRKIRDAEITKEYNSRIRSRMELQ